MNNDMVTSGKEREGEKDRERERERNHKLALYSCVMKPKIYI